MSKCDTMKIGETIRLTHRETEETITVRLVAARAGQIKIATDASQTWIITRIQAGGRESEVS